MSVIRRRWVLAAVHEVEVDLGSVEIVRVELLESGRGEARRYRCRFLLQSMFALNVANAEDVVDGVSLWGDFHAMTTAASEVTGEFFASSRSAAVKKALRALEARILQLRGDVP